MVKSLRKYALSAIPLGVAMSMAPNAFAASNAADIKNCAPENWCFYHRTVDSSWRHSPLKEINAGNVKNLKPAWIFQPGNVRMGMSARR